MSVFFHDAFLDHMLEIFLSEKCTVLLNWLLMYFCCISFFMWYKKCLSSQLLKKVKLIKFRNFSRGLKLYPFDPLVQKFCSLWSREVRRECTRFIIKFYHLYNIVFFIQYGNFPPVRTCHPLQTGKKGPSPPLAPQWLQHWNS